MHVSRLLLVPAMILSVPAAAQFYSVPIAGAHPSSPSIAISTSRDVGPEIRQVYKDINDGARSGQLSRGEARHLREEAGEIGVLEDRYAVNGLSDSETAELRNRAAALRSITDAERSGLTK